MNLHIKIEKFSCKKQLIFLLFLNPLAGAPKTRCQSTRLTIRCDRCYTARVEILTLWICTWAEISATSTKDDERIIARDNMSLHHPSYHIPLSRLRLKSLVSRIIPRESLKFINFINLKFWHVTVSMPDDFKTCFTQLLNVCFPTALTLELIEIKRLFIGPLIDLVAFK